jgi:hypothetical protein
MARKPSPPAQLADLRERAEQFAAHPRTLAALRSILVAPERLWPAMKDPTAFFASHGVKIPPSLQVELFVREPRTLPSPDWFPFVLEFFNCRSFWVHQCDDSIPPRCQWRQESVCFGFRVYPRLTPRIG